MFNKSTNVNTVGTQNAHHIAEGTLTSMSVADFLALVDDYLFSPEEFEVVEE